MGIPIRFESSRVESNWAESELKPIQAAKNARAAVTRSARPTKDARFKYGLKTENQLEGGINEPAGNTESIARQNQAENCNALLEYFQ